MDFISEKWDEITDKMRNEFNISNVSFETWIKPLKECCVKEDVVYIIIPDVNAGMSEYINSKYKSLFQVTISEMFDHTYNVEFVIEKDVSSLLKGEEFTTPSPVYNINYEAANLNPKYKFDTFVVGSNNKFAHSACLAVAESPGKAYNPLYLYGGAGLGKTHLMHSIGHFLLEKDSDTKVLYVTSEEFTNEVIESIRSGNAAAMTKLRDKYRTVDVLMVDDVQFIIGKESTQEEFFHTFNVLHAAGKQIVLSSDRPPKDIATNIKSNIRELEGAFNKIIAFSKLNKVNPSLELAEEALKDIISPDKQKEITPELIINVVSEHFGVKPEDIVSKKRTADLALTRQIVMYLCREYTDLSYQNIAKILNKKDHTTIIHGVNTIADGIKTDEDLNNKIDIIKKKLSPV